MGIAEMKKENLLRLLIFLSVVGLLIYYATFWKPSPANAPAIEPKSPHLAAIFYGNCICQQWADRFGIGPVHHMPPISTDADQPNLAQYLQMFRNRRLLQRHAHDQIAHRKFRCRQVLQNLAPAWFRNRVESIGRRRRSCHDETNIFLYRNMSSEKIFLLGSPEAGTLSLRLLGFALTSQSAAAHPDVLSFFVPWLPYPR